MFKRIEAMLVEDWRKAHKWLSVQIAALMILVGQFYDQLPVLQKYLPPDWVKYAAAAVIIARVIGQGNAKSDQ